LRTVTKLPHGNTYKHYLRMLAKTGDLLKDLFNHGTLSIRKQGLLSLFLYQKNQMTKTNTTDLHPIVVVQMPNEQDENNPFFDVTIVKDSTPESETYIETTLKETHPAYENIKSKIAILTMAGPGSEIPEVGEKFQEQVYAVFADKETYEAIRDGE
jgi:hypothetical protein